MICRQCMTNDAVTYCALCRECYDAWQSSLECMRYDDEQYRKRLNEILKGG